MVKTFFALRMLATRNYTKLFAIKRHPFFLPGSSTGGSGGGRAIGATVGGADSAAGGKPCAAYGGPRTLMEKISPVGSVYQAGTLSGNPVAMAAGIATLEIMQEDGAYEQLEIQSEKKAPPKPKIAANTSKDW